MPHHLHCFLLFSLVLHVLSSFQGQKVGGSFGRALPLIIFGTISVIAGLLTLYLPETLNTLMPETIEDAKDFGT